MKKQYMYMMCSMIACAVFATILNPSFIHLSNLITILRQASILLILSLGLTVVVLTGNIDLSIGSTAALTGCISASLMVSGHSIALSVFLSLFVGLLVGLINGLLVGALELPSFVATYGMNMVTSGIALMVMKGGVIYDLPEHFTWLGIGYVHQIPVPILLSMAMLLLFFLALRTTCWGRNIYMIGKNKMAAVYSAISYLRYLLSAYLLCGLTASIGGIVMTARLNAADAGMSEAYGLQIVAAVVVGGSSLLGGTGGVEGSFFGAILLTMIINIMNMNGINSNWQNFVMGLIILVIVSIQMLTEQPTEKRRKKEI